MHIDNTSLYFPSNVKIFALTRTLAARNYTHPTIQFLRINNRVLRTTSSYYEYVHDLNFLMFCADKEFGSHGIRRAANSRNVNCFPKM